MMIHDLEIIKENKRSQTKNQYGGTRPRCMEDLEERMDSTRHCGDSMPTTPLCFIELERLLFTIISENSCILGISFDYYRTLRTCNGSSALSFRPTIVDIFRPKSLKYMVIDTGTYS